MIDAQDVMSDYDDIMNDVVSKKDASGKVVKTERTQKLTDSQKLLAIFRVLLKVLVNIRSNQLLTETKKQAIAAAQEAKRAEKK